MVIIIISYLKPYNSVFIIRYLHLKSYNCVQLKKTPKKVHKNINISVQYTEFLNH